MDTNGIKLLHLIDNGTITLDDLICSETFIERAKFVKLALRACHNTITFPFGTHEVKCYDFTDPNGITYYGTVDTYCRFTCCADIDDVTHNIGTVDLSRENEVFKAFDEKPFSFHLQRFLVEQIKLARSLKE